MSLQKIEYDYDLVPYRTDGQPATVAIHFPWSTRRVVDEATGAFELTHRAGAGRFPQWDKVKRDRVALFEPGVGRRLRLDAQGWLETERLLDEIDEQQSALEKHYADQGNQALKDDYYLQAAQVKEAAYTHLLRVTIRGGYETYQYVIQWPDHKNNGDTARPGIPGETAHSTNRLLHLNGHIFAMTRWPNCQPVNWYENPKGERIPAKGWHLYVLPDNRE